MKGRFKEQRIEEARHGWVALQLSVDLMEVEAQLVEAKARARLVELEVSRRRYS